MTIKEIRAQIKTAKSPVVSLLTKGSQSKLIAIGLGKGVELTEHKAPGPTRIIILEGIIEYRTTEGTKLFTAMAEYQIPIDEIHSVIGKEHSIFLLSVNN